MRRWDSFTLVTPNWTVRLPGAEYRGGDPDGFMGRDEFAAYLARWAGSFGCPVRAGVAATALGRGRNGRLRLDTTDGSVEARAVVVATGTINRHPAGRPSPNRCRPGSASWTRRPTATPTTSRPEPFWWWAPARRAGRSPTSCGWRAEGCVLDASAHMAAAIVDGGASFAAKAAHAGDIGEDRSGSADLGGAFFECRNGPGEMLDRPPNPSFISAGTLRFQTLPAGVGSACRQCARSGLSAPLRAATGRARFCSASSTAEIRPGGKTPVLCAARVSRISEYRRTGGAGSSKHVALRDSAWTPTGEEREDEHRSACRPSTAEEPSHSANSGPDAGDPPAGRIVGTLLPSSLRDFENVTACIVWADTGSDPACDRRRRIDVLAGMFDEHGRYPARQAHYRGQAHRRCGPPRVLARHGRLQLDEMQRASPGCCTASKGGSTPAGVAGPASPAYLGPQFR